MGAMVIGVTVFAYFMGNTASSIAAYNSQETAVSKAVNQAWPSPPPPPPPPQLTCFDAQQ